MLILKAFGISLMLSVGLLGIAGLLGLLLQAFMAFGFSAVLAAIIVLMAGAVTPAVVSFLQGRNE